MVSLGVLLGRLMGGMYIGGLVLPKIVLPRQHPPSRLCVPRTGHRPLRAGHSVGVGGPVQENIDKAAKANPIAFVTKDDARVLIIHGDTDPLMPHYQSELLEAALKEAGVSVSFHSVKDSGQEVGRSRVD